MLDKLKKGNKWWVLLICALSSSLVALDYSSVPLALPQMQYDLTIPETTLQWVINAYLLSLTLCTILGGRLGDLLGLHRLLFSGIIIFILGSIACAMSHSGLTVILSRALQGIGGAFILPIAAAILINLFPNRERGRAVGYLVATNGIFLAIGPLLGGFVTEYFSWRLLFWLNIPIALLCLLLAIWAMPTKWERRPHKHIDWLGFFLLALFATSLVVGLMQGLQWGWNSPQEISLFTLALISLSVFIIVEHKVSHPLIHFKMFSYKAFTESNVIMLILKFALISTVFWSLYMQQILGFSPAMTGILLLPIVVPALFAPPWAGYLRDRYGPQLPAIIGTALTTVALFWLAYFTSKENYTLLFPAFLLLGCGSAIATPVMVTTAITSAAPSRRGVAGGISSFSRHLGNLIGLTAMGTVISNINKYYLTSTLQHFAAIKFTTLLLGRIHLQKMLQTIKPELALQIHRAANAAYVSALSIAMYMAGFICIIGLLTALRLPRKIED